MIPLGDVPIYSSFPSPWCRCIVRRVPDVSGVGVIEVVVECSDCIAHAERHRYASPRQILIFHVTPVDYDPLVKELEDTFGSL